MSRSGLPTDFRSFTIFFSTQQVVLKRRASCFYVWKDKYIILLFIRLLREKVSTENKANLMSASDVTSPDRTLESDMSLSTETASVEPSKVEQNRLWCAENQPRISAYAEEVAKEGMPLAGFRSF
jgi:antitoxin CcdA